MCHSGMCRQPDACIPVPACRGLLPTYQLPACQQTRLNWVLICVQESKEAAAARNTARASAAEVAELPARMASKMEHPRDSAVRKAGALLALPARLASKAEHARDDAVHKAGALLALPWAVA